MASVTKFQQRLAHLSEQDGEKVFDNLYRYIKQPGTLSLALDTVLAMPGAYLPGPDGKTKKQVYERTSFVDALATELGSRSYQPQPAFRRSAEDWDGGTHTIGVACLRDRVVQEAVRMVLQPIYESIFSEYSTGFRPERSVHDAIHRMTGQMTNNQKFWWVWVVDARSITEEAPHKKCLQVLRRKIACRKTLDLLKRMLQAGFMEGERVSKPNHGLFTTGILRPLLVNVLLHEMDRYWWANYGRLKQSAKDRRRREDLGNISLVRHGHRLALLTNGDKAFAKGVGDEFLPLLEPFVASPENVHAVLHHAEDGFAFDGFRIFRSYSTMSKKQVTLVHPSDAAKARYWEQVRSILHAKNFHTPVGLVFQALNKVTKRWSDRYKICNRGWDDTMDNTLWTKTAQWLRRKHANVSAKGSTMKYVYLKYRCRKSSWKLGWTADGVNLRRLKRKRFAQRTHSLGNVYLNEAEVTYCGEDYAAVLTDWKGPSKKGPYAHLWPKLLARDGGCVHCGSTDHLHIHHRVPQSEGGAHTLENTIILCRSCHKAEHAKG